MLEVTKVWFFRVSPLDTSHTRRLYDTLGVLAPSGQITCYDSGVCAHNYIGLIYPRRE